MPNVKLNAEVVRFDQINSRKSFQGTYSLMVIYSHLIRNKWADIVFLNKNVCFSWRGYTWSRWDPLSPGEHCCSHTCCLQQPWRGCCWESAVWRKTCSKHRNVALKTVDRAFVWWPTTLSYFNTWHSPRSRCCLWSPWWCVQRQRRDILCHMGPSWFYRETSELNVTNNKQTKIAWSSENVTCRQATYSPFT